MLRPRRAYGPLVALAAASMIATDIIAGCGSGGLGGGGAAGSPSGAPTGSGTGPGGNGPVRLPAPSGVPLPVADHVVIVFEENKTYSQIIGSKSAPYINALASRGAVFTQCYGITHPSQPNYLAFFSGSPQGVKDDHCPVSSDAPNLGSELFDSGRSYADYAEDMPRVGYTGCAYKYYLRCIDPAVDFNNVPASAHQPFTRFPVDFEKLPTVTMVIPNLTDNMHSASIQRGDKWLKDHVGAYAEWAVSHNSLLVVTWDEDDYNPRHENRIPMLFVGPMVEPGVYSERINHYNLLRTLEAMYNLPPLGNAQNVAQIGDCWARQPR